MLIKLCILKWRHTVSSNFWRKHGDGMRCTELYLQVHISHFNFDDMATIHLNLPPLTKRKRVFHVFIWLGVLKIHAECVVFLNEFYSNCLKIFSRPFVWSCNDRVSIVRDKMFALKKVEKATDVYYAFFLLNDYINGLERVGEFPFSANYLTLRVFVSVHCCFSGDWVSRPIDNIGICSPFFQSINFR